MKRLILAGALSLSAMVLGAAENSAVTFIGHETVAKGGSLVTQPNLSILIAHRTEPGMVEVHDTETDTIYVLDGAATIVTGGTMVGGKVTAPGQHRVHILFVFTLLTIGNFHAIEPVPGIPIISSMQLYQIVRFRDICSDTIVHWP